MGKSIREVYGTVLAELGDTNENIVVLDADLSGSTKSGIFAKPPTTASSKNCWTT